VGRALACRASPVPRAEVDPGRRAVLAAGAMALGALLVPARGAERYPDRPVRLIVPFPPGQASDIFARLLAQQLSIAWGQQVLVENRAGGAGVPAMLAGKAAAPDGYTLIMGTSGTLGITPSLYADPPYDPIKDFTPVSNVVIAPLVIVAHPSLAMRSIPELVAAASRAPGGLMYASPGQGTAQHMTAELLCARARIELRHVPYKGSGPAMVDLMGGQVTLMIDSVASSLPHLRSGKIRAIAVTTARRIPQLPEVPTVAEAGYPGFEGVGWAGIVLPAATPPAIVERVSADVQAALREAKLQGDFIGRGGIPDPRTPGAYAAFIRSEIDKWARVAREAKIRLDE
jgi:tripartite-type tricarboxylate transporter receptor subunit TctC